MHAPAPGSPAPLMNELRSQSSCSQPRASQTCHQEQGDVWMAFAKQLRTALSSQGSQEHGVVRARRKLPACPRASFRQQETGVHRRAGLPRALGTQLPGLRSCPCTTPLNQGTRVTATILDILGHNTVSLF